MSAMKEKRRYPRIEATVKVRYRVLKAGDLSFTDDEAVSHDMGLGGLALALGGIGLLGKDDLVRLEILEGEAQGLKAYAEVAWTGQENAGLKFMGILDNDVQRLRELVEARLQGSSN